MDGRIGGIHNLSLAEVPIRNSFRRLLKDVEPEPILLGRSLEMRTKLCDISSQAKIFKSSILSDDPQIIASTSRGTHLAKLFLVNCD
jgi:hypothetical protein